MMTIVAFVFLVIIGLQYRALDRANTLRTRLTQDRDTLAGVNRNLMTALERSERINKETNSQLVACRRRLENERRN